MRYKHALLLILQISIANAHAGESVEQPSDELLDFLGQWQQVDGDWIDPTELQDISMLEQKHTKGEDNEK